MAKRLSKVLRENAESSSTLARVAAERSLGALITSKSTGKKSQSSKSKIAQAEFADVPSPAPTGLTADVTDELGGGAVAFGDVLKSIGQAIVVSQAALDEAAIESAKALSATKIDVAVSVRQPLDENGNLPKAPPGESLPPEDETVVDMRKLSLSNFILPTLHQWQHVAVSMDLTVSEIDATSGLKLKSSSVGASFGVSAAGYSASGEFGYSSVDAEARYRGDFAQGAVRMDALLGPREEFRYPATKDYAIGPKIHVTQEALVSSEDYARGVKLNVKITKKDRSDASTAKCKVTYPAVLKPRLKDMSESLANGSVDIKIANEFKAEPAQNHRIQIKFGDLAKNVDVYL